MTPQLHFFIGKGGVGKSTVSALWALHCANLGGKILLVSMDPAHNQQDIFERAFSEKPRSVAELLEVMQVDTEHWTAKYLKDTEAQIKRAYSYQNAFNLQSCFNVLRFSPGIEEYALLLAFKHLLQDNHGYDIIVIDMPPTALTLRFFALPFATLVWLQELLKFRKSIYAKKQIISKIKFGNKRLERDVVKARLEYLIDAYRDLRDDFTSQRTHINLVMNNDRLSRSESIRIKTSLIAFGLLIRRIIINKALTSITPSITPDGFESDFIIRLPFSDMALAGLDALNKYLENNRANLPDANHLFAASTLYNL